MKIIIAADSFKGALRSPDVCAAIMRGLRRALPDAELIAVPMADGGEGTVQAVIQATGGTLHQAEVCGPLMKPVSAEYGLIHGPHCCAIFEMAAAARSVNVPTILLSGALKGDFSDIFLAAWSITRGPRNLENAIEHTAINLEMAAANVGNILKI